VRGLLQCGSCHITVGVQAVCHVVAESGIYLWTGTRMQVGDCAEGFRWILLGWPLDEHPGTRQILLELLARRTPIKFHAEPGQSWGRTIASGIRFGSTAVSRTVGGAAAVTSGLLATGGDSLRHRVPARQTPTVVSPQTRSAVNKADVAANQLRGVTSTVVNTVKEGADRAAKTLAPEIVKKAAPMSRGIGGQHAARQPAGSTKDQAVEVAMAGAAAAVLILGALDEATAVLTRQVSAQATETVRHRHGDEAGDVAAVAFGAAETAVTAVRDVRGLGIKSTAKRVGKKTMAGVVTEYDEKSRADADDRAASAPASTTASSSTPSTALPAAASGHPDPNPSSDLDLD
jgi:hypothetical protein